MKYKLLLFVMLLGLGAGGLHADCSLAVEQCSGVPVRVLKNGYLQVKAAPQACGAVVGLRYLPLGTDLMPPFEYKVEKIDLLPDQVQVGGGGGRTVFWGQKFLPAQPMTVDEEVSKPERAALGVSNQYYQGLNCSLVRQVILERGAAALKISFTLKNTGNTPLVLRPWDNLVAHLDPRSKDDVLLPGRGGVSHVGGIGVQRLDHDGIFIKGRNVFAKEVKIAAARNWIARRNDGSPLILAMRLVSEPMPPDGFFYCWSSDGDSPVRTMEIICPPVNLAPGGERTYELEYMIFRGLDNLKEICSDIGINCEIRKDRLEWQFAVVRSTPAQTLKVYAGDQALGELQLPAMQPGQAYRAELPLNGLPAGELPVSGEFSGGARFRLLEPMPPFSIKKK